MADGMGCKCCAYNESECGCGVDWTPQEIYDLREKGLEMREDIMLLRARIAALTAPPSEGEIEIAAEAADIGYYEAKAAIETFMEGRR